MSKKTINGELQRGFCLYELLVAAAISAIFLTMVSFGFLNWWQPMQARQLQQELKLTLHRYSVLARQLGHKIQLCGIGGDSTCNNDWSKGWQAMDEVGHRVLEIHPLSGQLSLIWAGSLGQPVRFAATGRPDGMQGGWRCRLNGRELFHLVLLRVM